MASLEAIKADANDRTRALAQWLRAKGYVGGDGRGELSVDLNDLPEEIEVIYNAYLAFDDLARRLATL